MHLMPPFLNRVATAAEEYVHDTSARHLCPPTLPHPPRDNTTSFMPAWVTVQTGKGWVGGSHPFLTNNFHQMVSGTVRVRRPLFSNDYLRFIWRTKIFSYKICSLCASLEALNFSCSLPQSNKWPMPPSQPITRPYASVSLSQSAFINLQCKTPCLGLPSLDPPSQSHMTKNANPMVSMKDVSWDVLPFFIIIRTAVLQGRGPSKFLLKTYYYCWILNSPL